MRRCAERENNKNGGPNESPLLLGVYRLLPSGQVKLVPLNMAAATERPYDIWFGSEVQGSGKKKRKFFHVKRKFLSIKELRRQAGRVIGINLLCSRLPQEFAI